MFHFTTIETPFIRFFFHLEAGPIKNIIWIIHIAERAARTRIIISSHFFTLMP